MNSIFFTVITLLLLTAGVLLLMQEFNKTKVSKDVSEPLQPELMSKEEGEDHFSVLMNAVTPVWYWRVNHEYIDFLHATIKRMKMAEINDTPGLFDAQRRCSDLNSAVYKLRQYQKALSEWREGVVLRFRCIKSAPVFS